MTRQPDTPAKTPGQIAYEADVVARPVYHDGKPRLPWHQLSGHARSSWEIVAYPHPKRRKETAK